MKLLITKVRFGIQPQQVVGRWANGQLGSSEVRITMNPQQHGGE